MIPTLSCLSVNYRVVSCLRNWCSMSYLSISPLHDIFRLPPRYSRLIVSMAVPELSSGISPRTYQSAYAPFKPNKSGQRLPPTYYRGCWHVVSRGLFTRYLQLTAHGHFIPWQKQFTTHNAFFLHAAWLDQALTHCPIFPTAASRRSLARISVPVWGITLSGPLLIIVLVGHYPAN